MGFLAYNLRTVWATAPNLCILVDIMGPHLLHQTDLRKAAQILPEKRKKSMTSYLVSVRSISFWLCMPLPKGCKIFVLKLHCEIPRGFGEIKVYTFGTGYFNGRGWEFRNVIGSEGHFRLGVTLYPSCADYFVHKHEVNRLRNDRDIAVWQFCIELNARGLGDWHWQLVNDVDGRSCDFAQ